MKKLFTVTIVLIMLTFLIFSSLVFFTDVLDVKEIDIKGSMHYTDEEILEVTGNSKEIKAPYILLRYLFEVLKDKKISYLEEIYLKCPYIKDIKIDYMPPGKIIFNITERIPKAVIKLHNSYILTDINSYALEVLEDFKNKKNHILIEGFVENNYRLGREIFLKGDINIKSIYSIIEIMEKQKSEYNYGFMEELIKIDVLPGGIINLVFDNSFKIKFNIKDDLNYKINYAGNIVYIKNVDRNNKTLDMTLTKPTLINNE
jgi:hypothetical protein